jgi:cupin 2 domain-containing protein
LAIDEPLRPQRLENLFEAVMERAADEDIVELLARPGLRIERIVSNGHASPPGFWYDQPHGEWVVVLQGEARLLLEGESKPRVLRRGDFLELAPHQRHRVEWTHPQLVTIWLAVHYTDTNRTCNQS